MSVGKLSDRNGSEDSLVSQPIGEDPILPVSKAENTHLPVFQMFHAFDRPVMPGWPFLNPVKPMILKCEKCSQEFYSSINYKRHTRVHRRPFHVNKESNKNRDLLAAFWDKLSLEEVERVASFDNAMLKELPGSTITAALASSLGMPGRFTLPQPYVKAGSTLLDIIQTKPSGLPISSNELFNVLDDASEGTFLCAGTADAVQKYVLDGEYPRQCLELKNAVATTSFLFEWQLVNAWLVDKEAEALRCHKLLVEEEEAAQRRQAELVERKRLKKLRRKEQKAKEQLSGRNDDLNVEVDRPASAEESTPPTPSDSTSDTPDLSKNLDLSPESALSKTQEPYEDIQAQLDLGIKDINPVDSDLQMVTANEHQRSLAIHQQASKSVKDNRNGFHADHNVPISEPETNNKLVSFKDRAVTNKVWTKKLKTNSDLESLNLPPVHEDACHQVEEDNCEMMIGSIAISVRTGVGQQQVKSSQKPQDLGTTEYPLSNRKNPEKRNLSATVQSGASQVPSMLWRPLSRGETKSTPPVLRVKEVSEQGPMLETAKDRILSDEGSTQSQSARKDGIQHGNDTLVPRDGNELGNSPFSTAAAREFLKQRWEEAISSDHVVLAFSPGPDPTSDVRKQQSSQVKFIHKVDSNSNRKYISNQKAIA